MPNELEGDYLRRLGRFFLKLALYVAPLNALWFAMLTTLSPLMQDGWRLYIFVLTTLLLPVTLVLALVGAWVNYVKSLSEPRSSDSPSLDLLILASFASVIALFSFFALHMGIDGLATGNVRLRRSSVNIALDPNLYWFAELFWIGSGLAGAIGGSKQCWSMFKKIRNLPAQI